VRILVTGADGFVGAALCPALAAAGHTVIAATRRGERGEDGWERRALGDLGAGPIPASLFDAVDAVIHLAARVHVMRERSRDPLAEFRRVNVEGTRRLVYGAAAAGVRRFVLLSSIKVNGEASPGRPFTESDPPHPGDAYGVSKFEAEAVLNAATVKAGIETVVIRAPLVYGPNVRANFRALLRLCDTALPLPFGAVRNRRSMIYRGNLADALMRAATAPQAAGRTYLVRDPEDLSTRELVVRLRHALGRPARLFPCPPILLGAGAVLAGRTATADRLIGTLTLDDSRIRHDLGWQPPHATDAGLAATVAWYRAQRAA
jgi:nucleoside-diphosphate-sugar epimerase